MRKLWGIDHLAEFLDVPKSWIYERTRIGGPELIPHMKLGKYLRFDPTSRVFKSWLESHQVLSHPTTGSNRSGSRLYSESLQRQGESNGKGAK